MKDIVQKLERNISKTNLNKSSYWKKYLENRDYKNIYEMMNFGGYEDIKFFRSKLHFLLSFILHGPRIFFSKTYFKYKKIYKKAKRQIINDTLRHVHAIELIKRYIAPKTICVIGDGKANFVVGALLTFSKAKIISVNLSDTLINDLLILNKMNILKENEIHLVENPEEILERNDKRLFLVPSNLKNFLYNKKIELFVNIASFQEMNFNEIENYMNIIKENKAMFYCCNREFKQLPDGEKIYFDRYPWGDGNKIFEEDCSWHKYYYQFRFPFFKEYDGIHKHCMIDYSKK
jgi:hypothetical protein